MAYDPGNYTMERTSSALQGAQSGAAIGSSVMPGWGTLIGGVIGGAGGYAMGGPTDAQSMRDEYLKKLIYDEQMGMLGLSDEERRQLEANMLDPVLAQQRQAENVYRSGLGIQDVGAGQVARQQLARQALEQKQLAGIQQQMNSVNMQMALAEKQALVEMMEERGKEQEAARKEVFEQALKTAPYILQGGEEFAEIEAAKAKDAAAGVAPREKIFTRYDREVANISEQMGLPPDTTAENLQETIEVSKALGVDPEIVAAYEARLLEARSMDAAPQLGYGSPMPYTGSMTGLPLDIGNTLGMFAGFYNPYSAQQRALQYETLGLSAQGLQDLPLTSPDNARTRAGLASGWYE